jgi:hypothetical protein
VGDCGGRIFPNDPVMVGLLGGGRLDGMGELTTLAKGLREFTETWAGLLRDYCRRGMRGPEVFTRAGAGAGAVDSLPSGWLRVLTDERLRPAIRVRHADPGKHWGLDELARAAAMSRTSFAERFQTVAGVPPLAYLGRWRMLLA